MRDGLKSVKRKEQRISVLVRAPESHTLQLTNCQKTGDISRLCGWVNDLNRSSFIVSYM